MSIEIITGFDGSCPHFPRGIERRDENTFLIRPGCRAKPGNSEEAPGCGSRLSLQINNKSDATLPIKLIVDWESDKRTLHHDLGYVRHAGANEWMMIPGTREGRIAAYHLVIPPGVTHFGLYPEYNYEACQQFVNSLAGNETDIKVIGQSRERRDIWQIALSSSNPKALPFFIQARDHAYETAGSYCVKGIADFLRSENKIAIYLRSKFNVYIVPMTNPDGAFNGMSRLTWEQGADMNRVHTVPDPAHDALKRTLDSIRPSVFMNIHNWTGKFTDGLLANEREIAERILSFMPADSAHYKHWKVETQEDWLHANGFTAVPEKHQSWKDYCKEQFGTICVTFEFPWFGLNTAAMRAKGTQAFVSLALAAIAERGW